VVAGGLLRDRRTCSTWPTCPTLGRCDPESGHFAGANGASSSDWPGTKFAQPTPIMIRGYTFLCVAVLYAQGSVAPDFGRVNDAKSWRVIDADVTVEGSVVRLKPHGDPAVGSNIGLALVQSLKFSEGTLEIDLRGADKQEASFLGLAFGVVDVKTFEAVYFRPFRFADDDPEAASHAVQYVAWPEYTWEKLRKDKPGA
jgi:hypothetical protein